MGIRRLAIFGIALAGAFPASGQVKDRKVDGHPNTFVLGLPSGYAPARKWPLLLLLHGSGDRAENMFPLWRTPELTKTTVVVALNSRNPQGWDGEDEKAILDLLPQLGKEYALDPQQVWIGGFSAGGFMASAVEAHSHKLFAGAIIMGSGDVYAQRYKDEYPLAAREGHFYLFVGEKDPNNPVMKQTDRNLDTYGCRDKKFVEAAGIGHTYRPQDVQEIGKWLVEAMGRVAASSEQGRRELKKRLDEADRWVSKQEYGKAILLFRGILESAGKETESGRKAAKALGDLDKKAQEMLDRARGQTDLSEKGKILEFLRTRFEGTEWARKAEDP